jgi:hypothetical protein
LSCIDLMDHISQHSEILTGPYFNAGIAI